MHPWEEESAPRHPLYVLSPSETGDDDTPRLVGDLREIVVGHELRVSSLPTGRFVGIDDALDNDPAIREAFLALSPDPALDRWRRLRPIALAAPVAWSMYVYRDFEEVSRLSADARQVVNSAEFKELERDPQTSALARAKHAKIDRAIAMKWTYASIEAAIGLMALLVIIVGLRRFRAIPAAVGFGAGAWWLFHAGQPAKCFRSFGDLALALLGLAGAIAVLVLAPSETRVVRSLRERLGLRADENLARRNQDLFATLAAAWAGISLPFLLRQLGALRVGDMGRTTFFVGFCFLAFFGFLAWRREESRVAPHLGRLAAIAALGFGITAACDIASRAAFGTAVEAYHCVRPQSTKLKEIQGQSAKETTAARRETQTQTLAFFIAVVAAPVAEEVLYRGTLQRIARRRLGARWSMLLSALVFGFAHALAFPAAFYQHFGLGLAFAAVFELGGAGAVGVVASAATHAMWNGWLAAMPVFG